MYVLRRVQVFVFSVSFYRKQNHTRFSKMGFLANCASLSRSVIDIFAQIFASINLKQLELTLHSAVVALMIIDF